MKFSCLACCLAFASGSTWADAAQASFHPVGYLNKIHGVNGDGSILVGQVPLEGGSQAYRWTAGSGLVPLGFFSQNPSWGLNSSAANCVDRSGGIVAGASSGGNGFLEAFRWTPAGGYEGLGDIDGGGNDSRAFGINLDGSVVVGYGTVSSLFYKAFRWSESGGIHGLGDLHGFNGESQAQNVSADGLVVAGTARTANAGKIEVFRWTPGSGMVGLGFLPGGDESFIGGMNVDGSVIVGNGTTGMGRQAFRWTPAGGMQGLGDFTGGGMFSKAFGVSADGTRIVGIGQKAQPEHNQPFLWTEALGMVDLQEHLIALGATELVGWDLYEAQHISADGNAIVGLGVDPNNVGQHWIAYLEAPDFEIGSAVCSPAVTNSTGRPGDLRAEGTETVCVDNVTLYATDLPPGQAGLFLNGRTTAFFPGAGGSLGNLCLAGSIGRYPQQVFNSGASGSGSLHLDVNDTPTAFGSVPILAGESWIFQCWYRESNPFGSSNFTDAVSIIFE